MNTLTPDEASKAAMAKNLEEPGGAPGAAAWILIFSIPLGIGAIKTILWLWVKFH